MNATTESSSDKVKWSEAMRILWLIQWRLCAIGAAIGLAILLPVGFTYWMTGLPFPFDQAAYSKHKLDTMESIVTTIAAILMYLAFGRMIVGQLLRKQFSGFRLHITRSERQ